LLISIDSKDLIDDEEINLKSQEELRQDSNINLDDSRIKDDFNKNDNFLKDLIQEEESINNIINLNLNNQSNLISITGLEKELNDLDSNQSKSKIIKIKSFRN